MKATSYLYKQTKEISISIHIFHIFKISTIFFFYKPANKNTLETNITTDTIVIDSFITNSFLNVPNNIIKFFISNIAPNIKNATTPQKGY